MDKKTIKRTMFYMLMPVAFIWYCIKRFAKFVKREWLRILLYSLMPFAFIVFCLKRVDKRVKWFRPAVVYMVIFTMLCTSTPVDVMAMTSVANISGTINADATWSDGAYVSDVTIEGGTIDDPIDITISGTVYSNGAIIIAENSYVKVVGVDANARIIRNNNTSAAVIDVNATSTLEVSSLILDGGAIWGGTVDTTLQRGTTNSGKTATTSLIKSGGQRTGGGRVILNNGVVLQNNVCTYNGHGGAITIGEDGSLTINGAVVKDNQNNSGNSGAIKMYAGSTLSLNAGEIYGNKAGKHGGAIQIFGGDSSDSAHVTFSMTGGTIRNNLAGGVGGALAISNYSDFHMSGGSIINNATTDSQTRGGGIGFGDEDTSMSISGLVNITGNTAKGKANNLYIGTNSNNILTVDDIIDGSSIGVYIASPSVDKVFSVGGASDVSMFSCDNEGYKVVTSDSNLKIVEEDDNASDPITPSYDVVFNANGGIGTMDSVTMIAESDYSLPECGFTAPHGYDFKGWSVDGREYNAGDSITVTADVEVKALWKPQSLMGTVSISGLRECGEILSVTIDDSNNTGEFSYQWYRVKDEVTAITNAIASSYELTNADVGYEVYCVVTSSVQTSHIQSERSGIISHKRIPHAVPEEVEGIPETILGKGDGKITGLTTEMEYSTSEEGPFTRVTDVNMNFAAGTYYIRYAEKENYFASEAVQVVVPNGPALQITTPINPNFDVTFDNAQLGWHEDVTIILTPKDGYTLTPDPEVKVNGVEVEVDIQENQKAVFVVEDIEGDIFIEATGILDVTMPTINLKVAENTWNKFWDELTIGILFNETQKVTITAWDTGSGVDKIFYYMSKKTLTYDEVEDIENWKEYTNTFVINPENEFIIYVKAMDKEGNIAYINSDNLVLLMPGNYEDVTPDTNIGGAKLDADIEVLKNDIPFTEKELEMVRMGADVDVWLRVEDVSDTVSEADKEIIAEKLGENQIGIYMDVSMFKQVGTNPAEKLTQLKNKISITFEVPSELLNENQNITRSYQIVRVHDGIAKILEVKYDAEKKTLTFETDCFSTYAILYKDTIVKEDVLPIVVPPISSPKTKDSDFTLWIALMFVSGGVINECVTGKRKSEETE